MNNIKLIDLEYGVGGIYKLNYPNGKIYIGQSVNIKRRIQEHNNINRLLDHHNSPCDLAILKYGPFSEIEILEYIDDKDLLNEREIYWISFYKSNDKKIGYNLTKGGWSTSGEDHPNATFTDAEVLDIRKRRFNGERKRDVYQSYSDKPFSTFEHIWLGQFYSNIGKEYIIPTGSKTRQEYSSIANSGENNNKAKLKKEDVIKIRELFDNGMTVAEIQKKYSFVTKTSIRRVCNRETWKNI